MEEMVLDILRQAFGKLDGLVYTLIAFVVIDYITGVMCAVKDRTLSNDVGLRGIFKKVIFVMVAIENAGDQSLVGTAGVLLFLINEGMSILENATRLGLPIPQNLKDILTKLHGKEEESK